MTMINLITCAHCGQSVADTEICPCPVKRSLRAIAREIRQTWPKVYFGAVPYLDAMGSLDNVRENYGEDSAKSIVLYFLSNATSWRGPDAKRIKAELKKLCDI